MDFTHLSPQILTPQLVRSTYRCGLLSILTLLESVSEDFESKNGIRRSELTTLGSGWGLRDEGFDLKGGEAKRVFSFIFEIFGVGFRPKENRTGGESLSFNSLENRSRNTLSRVTCTCTAPEQYKKAVPVFSFRVFSFIVDFDPIVVCSQDFESKNGNRGSELTIVG